MRETSGSERADGMSIEQLRTALLRSEEQRLRDRDALELAARRAEERLRNSDIAHEDYRRQIADLAASAGQLDRTTRDSEEELNRARRDLLRALEKEEALGFRIEELGRERDHFKNALEEARRTGVDAESVRAELNEVKNVRSELRAEVSELWQKIEERDREIRNLRARVTEREAEFEAERQRIQQRAQETARSSSGERLAQLEGELQASEEQKRTVASTLEQRERAWADTESLIQQITNERAEIEQQLAQRSGALEQALAELETVRGEMKSVRTSQAVEKLRTTKAFDKAGDYSLAELRLELSELD